MDKVWRFPIPCSDGSFDHGWVVRDKWIHGSRRMMSLACPHCNLRSPGRIDESKPRHRAIFDLPIGADVPLPPEVPGA